MSNLQISNRQTTIQEIKSPKGDFIKFYQNGEFMGFCQLEGALEIMYSALLYGHNVKANKTSFDVRLRGNRRH